MKTPLFLLAPAFLLTACAPTVQLSVPKPVVIDVSMKVDVTSRTVGPAAAPGAPAAANGLAQPTDAAATRNRISGEVQSLKDSRLIGENNRGYLEVRPPSPSGKLPDGEPYASYIARIVKTESDDRRVLNVQNAAQNGVPLQTVEEDAAKRLRDAAFSGEWVQDTNGTWRQK